MHGPHVAAAVGQPEVSQLQPRAFVASPREQHVSRRQITVQHTPRMGVGQTVQERLKRRPGGPPIHRGREMLGQ